MQLRQSTYRASWKEVEMNRTGGRRARTTVDLQESRTICSKLSCKIGQLTRAANFLWRGVGALECHSLAGSSMAHARTFKQPHVLKRRGTLKRSSAWLAIFDGLPFPSVKSYVTAGKVL